MTKSLEGISPFEKLPYEVLEHISVHLNENICQFRLLNRRCRSIAEKHLFNEFSLYSRSDCRWLLEFTRFTANPQRCKLVKTLSIKDEDYINLSDDFFQMFCNIDTVCHDIFVDFPVDWQRYNKIFTPERCRLKKLASLDEMEEESDSDSDEDEHHGDGNEHYFKAVEAHSQTLEYLDCTKIASRFKKGWSLPHVKVLTSSCLEPRLQDLDNVIRKCPMLETLYIEQLRDSSNDIPFILFDPSAQHQRQMKEITFRNDSTKFPALCTYLTTKFPNVQEWKAFNFTEDDDPEVCPVPFEEYMDALHPIMKSTKVDLQIHTTYQSFGRVFDFLKLHKAHTNISITYIEPDPYGDDLDDLLYVDLLYHQSKSALNTVELRLAMNLKHSDMLKKFGGHVQTLNLSLLDYGCDDDERMLQGNDLAHLLDKCPVLTSVKFKAHSLKSVGRTSKKVNKSLRKMVLRCETIDADALLDISHKAPGVVDLTISGLAFINGKKQGLFNMPNNNFDRLVLDYCSEFEEGSDVVLIKITSLASSETKYYVQEHNEQEIMVFTDLSDEQEYEAHLKLPYTKLSVICQSIKYIEYCSTWRKRAGCFNQRIFEIYT